MGIAQALLILHFSSDQYLMRTKSTFQMSEKNLPKKLVEDKPGGGGYELFEYEFYYEDEEETEG